jgi:hypothetical protein
VSQPHLTPLPGLPTVRGPASSFHTQLCAFTGVKATVLIGMKWGEGVCWLGGGWVDDDIVKLVTSGGCAVLFGCEAEAILMDPIFSASDVFLRGGWL